MGQLVINDSSLINNGSRTFGAGIYNAGQLWVTNTTFSNNWPDGLYNGYGGAATLNHVTMASTGGLYNEAEMTLNNSIVDGDSPLDLCVNEGNLNRGVNLISDGSCGATISGAAMLDPVDLYGGPTPTARPQLSSPALDAAADDDCEPLDQRGVERPEFYCDLGAHERVEGIVFQNGFEGYRYW
ncbi:MAG: choice-of-anchor Q domain-containing protein [Pseudomonadota bacterium]